MASVMFSKAELENMGVKLLSLEELQNVSPGDWVDCDVLHQSLLHSGFNARYENVVSDKAGFVAKFFIDEVFFGTVEGSDIGHMVREWHGDELSSLVV